MTTVPALPRSGQIQFEPEKCLACRECEIACSLYHFGECNPELSNIRMFFDDFVPGFPSATVCKQCDWPACYYACANKWDEPAIKIDEKTGARYVDPDICRGCGLCARACPLTPELTVMHMRKDGRRRKYFKCDLCYDRPEGPVCVEICPGNALTLIPAEERKR